MLSAIGSSIPSGTIGAASSTVTLEAQLDKLQIQLADWVSCPSGKTPEGKAKIKEISDKVSALEQVMKSRASIQQSNYPTAIAANGFASNTSEKLSSAPGLSDKVSNASLLTWPPQTRAIGSRLDLFA